MFTWYVPTMIMLMFLEYELELELESIFTLHKQQ